MLNSLIRKLPLVFIIVFVIAIAITLVFLYQNFYQTITYAGQISTLNQQVSPVSFDQKLWETVSGHVKDKKQPRKLPDNPRDPFK